MEKVILIARFAAVTLLLAQAAMLLVRSLSCVRRSSPLLLAGFLLCACLLLLLHAAGTARFLLTIPALWTAGMFLAWMEEGGRGGAVTGVCAGICAVLLPLALLGYGGGVPFRALQGFGAALAAFFPIQALIRVWRARRSTAALLTLICACIWLALYAAGLCARLLGGADPSLPDALPGFLFSLCTGWLIFQEGYPIRSGWRGALPALAGGEGDARHMAARLLESETMLEWQSRMITAGVLSLGAVHEFKNILSLVRVAAQHGLAAAPADKDESLRLVLEHADAARSSAVATLEMLAAEDGEPRRRIDAARDLARVIGRLRPALRGQGVIIEPDLAPGVVFSGRMGDVEQVLVNLVRNSAEAYRARGGGETGVIRITARYMDGQAVIEVRDRAGGVLADQEHRLFMPVSSGSGSTGLGLYLSRNIASQNGGVLEYQPEEGGSLFRLSFPVDEEDPEG